MRARFIKSILPLTLGTVMLVQARAEDTPPKSVEWGGFVDTYYAFDTNDPQNHDRAFTTQPARHNEINVNLAFIEAKLALERIRGRLALQAGTSVQSNYAGEPSLGTISGPSLVRHIQEATAGYRITDRLWVDAGIFFSHIGLEGFISRDNWTYSRSLVADYSPYYQAGVKFGYQFSNEWSAQLHVLNGWQNISENNMAKSVGTQISYTPLSTLTVSYNTLLGKETEFRHFHDLVVKWSITDQVQVGAQADLGFQKQVGSDSYNKWYGFTLLTRYAFEGYLALVARIERYWDKDQVIVTTSTLNGFQTWGASLGIDAQLHQRVVWRNEVRRFWSRDAVYPGKNGTKMADSFFVTSLALTI